MITGETMLTANGKRIGRPRNPPPPQGPEPNERPEYVARLQTILDALEIGDLTKEVRLYLQKTLRRCDLVRSISLAPAPKGEERITVLLRTVYESSNGHAALTLPILDAVSNCTHQIWVDKGLAWIEAFDRIDLVGLHATLTELGLADQLGRALHVKLEGIIGPPTVEPAAKPVKTTAKKLPARITRVALIEKRIEIGLKLIELRAKARRNNDFSTMRKKQLGDVDSVLATEATRVARIYGSRPDIFRRISWRALVELSSPSLSTSTRQRFEAAIRAGKDIKGPQVARARGRLPSGRPKTRG
jgi:hypothetical protein